MEKKGSRECSGKKLSPKRLSVISLSTLSGPNKPDISSCRYQGFCFNWKSWLEHMSLRIQKITTRKKDSLTNLTTIDQINARNKHCFWQGLTSVSPPHTTFLKAMNHFRFEISSASFTLARCHLLGSWFQSPGFHQRGFLQ